MTVIVREANPIDLYWQQVRYQSDAVGLSGSPSSLQQIATKKTAIDGANMFIACRRDTLSLR
jgi:hypothetical protein